MQQKDKRAMPLKLNTGRLAIIFLVSIIFSYTRLPEIFNLPRVCGRCVKDISEKQTTDTCPSDFIYEAVLFPKVLSDVKI